MKCQNYLIAILIGIGMLIALFFSRLIIKYRKNIIRFWKKKAIWNLIINVIVPFAVPFLLSILTTFSPLTEGTNCFSIEENATMFWLIWSLVAIAFINMVFQIIFWIKSRKEDDVKWENAAARCAYNNLFRAIMDKNAKLKVSYHHGLTHGMLSDADIPYDIFSQIRSICMQLCDTISEITKIEKKDLSASFIYHYCYDGATNNDKKWRWLTGKGAKFDLSLGSFVDRPGSTFHHMIHDGVASTFYNDKKNAEADGRYIFSYRDNSHNRIGSLFAVKVAFSGNDGILSEGIIMIDSYGYKFLDEMPRQSEEELKELILDRIMPVYRQEFQTELAMLYFRHETEPDEECVCKCSKKMPSHKKIQCKVEYNKTTWKTNLPAMGGCCAIKKFICKKKQL